MMSTSIPVFVSLKRKGRHHDVNDIDQGRNDKGLAEDREPHHGIRGFLKAIPILSFTHKLFDFENKLSYDVGGDIVHRQVKLGKDTYQESYEYLIDGSIKSVKNPMGLEGFYTSDAAGALRSVKIRLPGAQTVESIMDSISYNAKGQIDEILYRPFTLRHGS